MLSPRDLGFVTWLKARGAILGAMALVSCGGTASTAQNCSTQALDSSSWGQITVGAAGSIRRDYWLGLDPTTTDSSFVTTFRDSVSLTTPPSGNDKLTSLQTHGFNPGEEVKSSDYAINFGERMRGFIKAPVTGNYQFLVSGDNQVQFFLSTDDQPASILAAIQGCGSAVPGGNCVTSTAENLNFTLATSFAEPRQISAPITLRAGKLYLFDWYHREGQGNTHALVKWAKPGESVTNPVILEIVPSSVLYYPEFKNAPSGSGGGGGDTAVSPGSSGATGSTSASGGVPAVASDCP